MLSSWQCTALSWALLLKTCAVWTRGLQLRTGNVIFIVHMYVCTSIFSCAVIAALCTTPEVRNSLRCCAMTSPTPRTLIPDSFTHETDPVFCKCRNHIWLGTHGDADATDLWSGRLLCLQIFDRILSEQEVPQAMQSCVVGRLRIDYAWSGRGRKLSITVTRTQDVQNCASNWFRFEAKKRSTYVWQRTSAVSADTYLYAVAQKVTHDPFHSILFRVLFPKRQMAALLGKTYCEHIE